MTEPVKKPRPAILARSIAVLLGAVFFALPPRVVADQYWDGLGGETITIEGGAGTWDQITFNWTNAAGTTNSAYDSSQTAIFGLMGGGQVALGAGVSFTNLTFNSTAYTITGGAGAYTLTPAGTAILNAQTGVRAAISAKLTGAGGINLTGGGKINLSGSNDYSGGTTLSNGTLFTNSNSALGSGPLTITASGGAVTLGTNVEGTTLTNSISVQGDFSVALGSAASNFYLNGNIDLNGGTRTITGVTASSQVRFGGTISNGGLTLVTPFTAPGDYVAFILDANNVNTYTGLTTIGNGAFLVLLGNTPNGAIQGDVPFLNGVNDVLVEGNGVIDYLGGVADQIADTATVTVNSKGNLANGSAFAGLEFYGQSGDTIGALYGTGTVGLGAGTLTVGAGDFSGVISDGKLGSTGGKLTKNTAGTLILSGVNIYTGATTVTDGTLQAGAVNTLSKVSAVVVDTSGTLDLNSFNQTVGSIAGAGTITLGTATLTTGNDNTTSEFSGVIQGAGGLTKIGTGTTTLSGLNTYTGATTVNRGTLIIDTATNATVLDPASTLALGGGTFQLKGVNATSQSQTVASLTLNGGASVVSIDNNSGTDTTLNLGGITRSGHGTVDFTAAAGSTLNTDAFINTTQPNAGLTGILGGWATVNGGAALAANDGFGAIIAYTGYTDVDGTNIIMDDPTTNVRLNGVGSGDAATVGATNINTLTQNFATPSTIDLSAGTLRLGISGGLFITPSGGDLIIGTSPNSGILTAGGDTDGVDGEIVVGNFSGNVVTIKSIIADNAGGVVSLTKTGSGTLILTAGNSYTGVTTVNAGALSLNTAGANGISGNVVINGGTLLWQQSEQIADGATITVSSGSLNIGVFDETVAGVQLTGGSIDGAGGVLTSLSAYDLQAGSVSAILGGAAGLNKTTDGTVTLTGQNTYTGATTISGGALSMGVANAISTSSDVTVNANGNFNLNGFEQSVASIAGAGAINLGSATLTTGTGGGSTTFSGVIEGTGGLTKVGVGTLTLSGQNVYSGATTITEGTLQTGIANAISIGSAVTVAAGATLDLTLGPDSFNQSVASIAGDGTIQLGAATLTTGRSGASTTFSGSIQGTGGLTKVGAGTLTLAGSNTYSGTTAINGGRINLSGSLIGPVSVDNGGTFSVVSGGGVNLGNNVTIVTMSDGNTLFNSGSLVAGNGSTGVSAVNSNDIENLNILTVGNNSTGISAGSNNYIENSGPLTAGDTSTGIRAVSNNSIYNYNSLTVGGGSTGIKVLSLNTVSNNGPLVTGNNSTGIDAGTSNSVSNSSSLTVGSNSTGINVVKSNTVSNSGTVNFGDNSVGIQTGNANSINNSGTLQGGATGSVGVRLTLADNTLTNASGGIITATTGVVIGNPTGGNNVINYGIVTGTGGVAVDASATTANLNYITLDPNNSNFDPSQLNPNEINIVNLGTFNGSVLFGSGNATVTLVTGVPQGGSLNGGGGTNTLRLVGTETDTLNLSTVTNFAYLKKLGGGTWILTGEGSFPGGTDVELGNLYVEGNLTSNVTVQSAGLLGGRGLILGNLVNAGTVNPGSSPGQSAGTLTVKGNFIQGSSGTLVIEIYGKKPGEYDVLAVQGQANLDGNLRLESNGKNPRLKVGEQITFLTAEGGVTGRFAKVTNPFTSNTMVRPEVVYGDNSVSLEGTQGSYREFARRLGLSSNERSVARVVDAAAFGGKEKKMVEYLNSRTLDKVPGDLDRVAPEELASIYHIGVGLADVQGRNAEQRMEEIRLTNRRITARNRTAGNGQVGAGGVAGPDGQYGKNVAPPEPPDRWGSFFTGTGQVTRVGRTDNARGYDLNTGGVTVGVDYQVTPNLAVGVSLGYANTGARLVDDGKVDVNSGKLGVYATYFTGGFHADAALGSGFSSYETRRTALGGTARGKTEGLELSALAGAGYDWHLEEFTLGPIASVQYTYVGLDEFTERGSLAPLTVTSQHEESIRSTLGFKTAYDWTVWGLLVRPEIRAAWRHEYGDRSFSMDSRLASGAGGIFTVEDAETGRDSLQLGVGVTVLWSETKMVYLFYDGELLRKEYDAHNLSGGLRLTF